ncbi:unnamed protein product [Ectocarpus sp. 8 AP-2014]
MCTQQLRDTARVVYMIYISHACMYFCCILLLFSHSNGVRMQSLGEMLSGSVGHGNTSTFHFGLFQPSSSSAHSLPDRDHDESRLLHGVYVWRVRSQYAMYLL